MPKAKRARNHAGTVYRRADGLWVARVMYDGRRYQVSAASEIECGRKLRQKVRDLDEGKETPAQKARATFAHWSALWLSAEELAHPATYKTYRSYTEGHLDPAFGSTRLGQISKRAVIDFYRGKLEAGYKVSTVRQMALVLRACLNDALAEGYPVSPSALKAERPAAEYVERVVLTPAQVGKLFRDAELRGDSLRALWVLIWYSTRRLGEMLALGWQSVDLARREIVIERIQVGCKDGIPAYRYGKSRRSRMIVPIPDDAVAALRAHFDAQEARKTKAGESWTDLGLVFDRGDGRALHHSVAEARFYKALDLAGLPKVRIHDLRHASGTALQRAGHDLTDIQIRLGHASINTTVGTYLHPAREAEVRAGETLERLVRTGTDTSN